LRESIRYMRRSKTVSKTFKWRLEGPARAEARAEASVNSHSIGEDGGNGDGHLERRRVWEVKKCTRRGCSKKERGIRGEAVRPAGWRRPLCGQRAGFAFQSSATPPPLAPVGVVRLRRASRSSEKRWQEQDLREIESEDDPRTPLSRTLVTWSPVQPNPPESLHRPDSHSSLEELLDIL
jgi:hypothetical protein